METYKIDAIPLSHDLLDIWRDAFSGIQYFDPKTNFVITGGVDDIWISSDKKLIIVDYKSTSKESEVNLEAEWQESYKRQMEIYQWLFKKNAYKVSDTGYFVYCNGNTDKEAFDGKLEFDIKLIPYVGNSNWVDDALIDIKNCLDSDQIPARNPSCDYCIYTKEIEKIDEKI